MKTLQNNFTTPEQSKRLLELGLPADSADCLIYEKPYYTIHVRRKGKRPHSHNKGVPCWSVGRLIEIYEICSPIHIILDKEYVFEDGGLVENLVCSFEGMKKRGIDFSKLEE